MELALRRSDGNRLAIGTQVRATIGDRTLLRFVNGGNGFAGQSSTRIHLGLDAATAIDRLELRWPDGERQTLTNLAADRIYEITEARTETRVLPSGVRHAQ